MPYVKRIAIAGNIKSIAKYYTSRFQTKGIGRGQNQNITPDDVQKLNDERAEWKLWLLIKANFKPKDIHAVLTYKPSERPSAELARKHIAKFLRDARKIYKQQGKTFKYIWTCEYEGSALHFHLIIPQIDISDLVEAWKYGQIRPTYMYAEGDYKALAHYIIKETTRTAKLKKISGKRYNASNNLTKPIMKREIIKSDSWTDNPRIPKGWVLSSKVRTGYGGATGTPFQYYEIKKLE
ncbi:MAG: hypothetical protein RR064_07260 [Oscillospiraceae bacterium]